MDPMTRLRTLERNVEFIAKRLGITLPADPVLDEDDAGPVDPPPGNDGSPTAPPAVETEMTTDGAEAAEAAKSKEGGE